MPVTDRNGVPLKRYMTVSFKPADATPPVLARLKSLGCDPAAPCYVYIEHVVHSEGHDEAVASAARPLIKAGQASLAADKCDCRHCKRTLVDDNYRHDFHGATDTLEVTFNAGTDARPSLWHFHVLPSIVEAKGTLTPPATVK